MQDKNATGEVNVGYEIKESVVFTNNRGFALAYNPSEELFVTWQFTENEKGKRDYYWGNYVGTEIKARRDYTERISEYQKRHSVTERPRRFVDQLAEAEKQVERGNALATDKKQCKHEL